MKLTKIDAENLDLQIEQKFPLKESMLIELDYAHSFALSRLFYVILMSPDELEQGSQSFYDEN